MNELLGLCSGSFSEESKKKSESELDVQELLGLCSGKFYGVTNSKASAGSQDNMNELLGLCSGQFTNENRLNAGVESQDTSKLDMFDSKTNISDRSESSKKDQMLMNEMLRNCSGQLSSLGNSRNSGNKESESYISSALSETRKRNPKSKQGLSAMFENMKNDENSMSDVLALCSGKVFSYLFCYRREIISKLQPAVCNPFEELPGYITTFISNILSPSLYCFIISHIHNLHAGSFSDTRKEQMGENMTLDEHGSDVELDNSENDNNCDVDNDSEKEMFSEDEEQPESDADEKQDDSDDEMIIQNMIKKSKKYDITYGKNVQ